ncbi:MAG: ORF6N domain-containing protein [Bacteroidales bacterium]|nr:ORF6N domain-containing protein [Candidatus Cacconaster scatequi]
MNGAKKRRGEEFSATVAVRPEQGDIRSMIYTVRGVQVMLDRDLALLYQVTTSALNQAVKRNILRFPEDFRFQLTETEWDNISSQNVMTSLNKRPKSSLPYVFTEEGVAQLSGILKSRMALDTSIRVMRAFTSMRRFLVSNAGIFQRLELMERQQILSDQRIDDTNTRIDQILDRMEDGTLKAKLGIFFEGQMFDAFVLVETLFRRATRRIVLIDDYVSGDILQRMRVRPGLTATIDCYVRDIHRTSEMEQAFRAYNAQYPDEHCRLHTFNGAHDRFMIIDDEVYHFGASIKDMGKRWFGVNLITEHTADELIARLQSPSNRGL